MGGAQSTSQLLLAAPSKPHWTEKELPPSPLQLWVLKRDREFTTSEINEGVDKILEENARYNWRAEHSKGEQIRLMINYIFPRIVLKNTLSHSQFQAAIADGLATSNLALLPNGGCLRFSIANDDQGGSVVGMAWATGEEAQFDIGLEIKKIPVGWDSNAKDYFKSVKNKLTPQERKDVKNSGNDLLAEVTTVLTIKEAFIKATKAKGPNKFHHLELEYSLKDSILKVNKPVWYKWEIRLHRITMGSKEYPTNSYQCCAIMMHTRMRAPVKEIRVWKQEDSKDTSTDFRVENFVDMYQSLPSYWQEGGTSGKPSPGATEAA